MLNRLGGFVILVAALAAAWGCNPRPADEAAKSTAKAEDAAAMAGDDDETALGAYLAGRFAQNHGDTKAAADYFATAIQYDRDNVELMQRAFTLLLAEGRMAEARPLADRLLALDEDAPLPALVVGVQEAHDGHFAEAEKHFAALPHKGINAFLGPLLTAWARTGEGRIDAGLGALEALGSNSGFGPIYEFHAGLISDLAERPDAADKHYRIALAAQTSVRTIEAAGAFYQRSGKFDNAREIYSRYHTEHPDRLLFDGASRLAAGAALARPVNSANEGLAEALFDTATLMRQGNAFDLAMVFSRLALSLEPKFPLAEVLLADVLTAQGRLPEADVLYRGIDPSSQVSAFARLRLAVNLDEAGDTDGAVKELRALAKARPEGTDALMTLGDVLRRHKRFADAADAYDQAVQRLGSPVEARSWPLYYARGIALERAHQWQKAEPDLLKALELSPEQPDVLNYLGYTWVDQGINLDRARKMIEKAVQLRPNDGAIVDSLGWALYRMGSYQESVKQMERAVELKPEDATINEHLGDALWQVGRVSEARFQWQRAMTLDPEPEQIAPLKAKIETGTLPAKPVN
jgi:tetratricopeptide (TPR) repeat protein